MRSCWRRQWQLRCPSSQQVSQSPLNLPWLSRRAHLRLMPGSSASLAPDSRSRAAVLLPLLLWLRAEQMLQWGMTVVLLINFHRLGRLCLLNVFRRSTNQCRNLDYLVQCVFARGGPVRLPQHLQCINRLSSPIRSLSLLRNPCSPLLTPRFPFSALPAKVCKSSNPKSISCFRGPSEGPYVNTLVLVSGG